MSKCLFSTDCQNVFHYLILIANVMEDGGKCDRILFVSIFCNVRVS